MRLLVLSQLRFLRHAPWSAATALLGVILGVASVVAVHLIGVGVQRSLDEATPPHLAGLSHVLERPDLTADQYFDLRDRWRSRPGSAVSALVPMVEGRAVSGGRRILVVGIDWLAMPAGAGPASAVPTEVLTGEAVLADGETELAEGDVVSLGGRALRVARILESGLGAAVFADIAAAQVVLEQPPGRVSRIGVAVEEPWAQARRWLDRLMPGLSAGLPGAGTAAVPEALSVLLNGPEWRVRPVAAERPSAGFARAILFNLGALGTLALLVAWFLIYQVAVIWLRRQRLLLRRLHVMGASPGELRRAFLAVFVALGMVATAAGLAAGSGLASLLVTLSERGAGVAASGAAVPWVDAWVIVKAVASGLGVCLLGGYGAFARAWRPRAGSAARSWILATPALLAVAVAGVVWEATGMLGGFAAILAMSLAAVALVSPLLTAIRAAGFRLRLRLLHRLAVREAVAYPGVLGVALGALTLAVATGIGIATMVDSFRLDFIRMLESRLSGDLYVYDAAPQMPGVARWLEAQPEVAAVRPAGRARVRLQGEPVELGYARFDAAESARYGHPRALEPGAALVSEQLARRLDLEPGDAVAAPEGRLVVAGVFPGFGDPLGRVLVNTDTVSRFGLAPRFDRLAVDLAAPGEALTARLAQRFPALSVQSRTALRAQALAIFERTFAITRALTLLALLVAVVAMYNALTAQRLQQAPVLRLLRAQGLDRREARRLALMRSGIAGAVAMVLALPLGLAMAWTLCHVINPRSFGWTVNLHLSWQAWLGPLLLGMAAALLAGALPAPRERGTVDDA
ncbi:MAG: FtsX-like permease family protein [Pseudomonadota bacterium]